MTGHKHPSSLSERLMSLLVLVALIGIARWVYERQFRFNPALTRNVPEVAAAVESTSTTKREEADLAPLSPEGLEPLSAPERFDKATLSDKIDGKADLYLSAGFVSLTCRRFRDRGDPMAWIESYIFAMESPRSAFAAYSAQRRGDAEEDDLSELSYATPNSLFFVHGPFYVEIVSSQTTEALMQAARAVARTFIDSTPVEAAVIPELALFPAENQVEGSVMLFRRDGFGYERFDELFSSAYRTDGGELTAFLSVRRTAAEAVDLATSYSEFLVENGATYEAGGADVEGFPVYNLFGTYEIIFSRGRVVAGVHQADNLEGARRLAVQLSKSLGSGKP